MLICIINFRKFKFIRFQNHKLIHHNLIIHKQLSTHLDPGVTPLLCYEVLPSHLKAFSISLFLCLAPLHSPAASPSPPSLPALLSCPTLQPVPLLLFFLPYFSQCPKSPCFLFFQLCSFCVLLPLLPWSPPPLQHPATLRTRASTLDPSTHSPCDVPPHCWPYCHQGLLSHPPFISVPSSPRRSRFSGHASVLPICYFHCCFPFILTLSLQDTRPLQCHLISPTLSPLVF